MRRSPRESRAGERQVSDRAKRDQALANCAEHERKLRRKMDPHSFTSVSEVIMARSLTLRLKRQRDTEGRDSSLIYDEEMRRLVRQLRRLAETPDERNLAAMYERGDDSAGD